MDDAVKFDATKSPNHILVAISIKLIDVPSANENFLAQS